MQKAAECMAVNKLGDDPFDLDNFQANDRRDASDRPMPWLKASRSSSPNRIGRPSRSIGSPKLPRGEFSSSPLDTQHQRRQTEGGNRNNERI